MLNIAQIIAKKRDSQTLSEEEIRWLIDGFHKGSVSDSQMSAMAMAILCRGMDVQESTWMTQAMIDSGSPISWKQSTSKRPKIDKHSTGGIGDKISIPLTPILACMGMDVPMISGRGLGPTGGTLDKLESIPEFDVNLSRDKFIRQTEDIGCAIVAAGNDLAPADKKLYALRDVTGTVPSLPLITSSILSKKVSEGLNALVMDVKFGSGAFMKTAANAEELANRIVEVAKTLGVPTTAMITNMDRPLGRMIGNACEIAESIEILEGSGPEDVRKLTLQIAAESFHLLSLGSVEEGMNLAINSISSGKALEKFHQLISAQGGKLDQFDTNFQRTPIESQQDGFVQGFDAEKLGYAVIEMRGGRKQQGDQLNYRTGIEMLIEEGSKVSKGQPLVNILDFTDSSGSVEKMIRDSIRIGEIQKKKGELIIKIIRP